MSAAPLRVPKGLHWFSPPTERGCHELRDGEHHTIGSLRFLSRPAITWAFTDPQAARAEVGSSHWHLSIALRGISGFFGASGTALIDDGRTGTIESGPFFASGALSLSGGRIIEWKGSVFEGTTCGFVGEDGTTLVEIAPGSYFTRVNGTVEVHPEAADMAE